MRAADGELALSAAIVALQAAIGVSAIAFGGLNWALDGAAAPVAAVAALEAVMAPAGALPTGGTATIPPGRGPELRFRDVSFGYPGGPLVLDGFDLTIPAGRSLAIVGQNGAGKTTLAKLLCRLYDPTSGAVEADGIDLRALDLSDWRQHVTAVFQDFVRFELSLRDNVAPVGRLRRRRPRRPRRGRRPPRRRPRHAARQGLPRRHRPVRRPVAARRARPRPARRRRAAPASCCSTNRRPSSTCAARPRSSSASSRATRGRTTILVSHRFSTVRQADRICVLEHGAVVELGTHDELMALGGRYRTMFELQASRFVEVDEHGEEVVHEHL